MFAGSLYIILTKISFLKYKFLNYFWKTCFVFDYYRFAIRESNILESIVIFAEIYVFNWTKLSLLVDFHTIFESFALLWTETNGTIMHIDFQHEISRVYKVVGLLQNVYNILDQLIDFFLLDIFGHGKCSFQSLVTFVFDIQSLSFDGTRKVRIFDDWVELWDYFIN